MNNARSTTNTISVNHQVSQTVLRAAQITAVAFLTLVLAVGLQAATASLAHATETDTPTHIDVETIEDDAEAPCEVDEDCDWPRDGDCLAESTSCMRDGWLSAWVDLDRETAISRQYNMPSLAEWTAVWENVDFSPYNRVAFYSGWLDHHYFELCVEDICEFIPRIWVFSPLPCFDNVCPN